MGWKNVKEHYKIGHMVHVRDGNLCIGSPYISEIIIVSADGKILKGYERQWSANEDLLRYTNDIAANKDKFVALFKAIDIFDKFVKIYTHKDGKIIEKFCEDFGEDFEASDCTHDGELMMSDFSEDRSIVVKACVSDAEYWVTSLHERILEKSAGLLKLREEFRYHEDILVDLRSKEI